MNRSQSWKRTAITAALAVLAFGVGGVSALAAGAFGGSTPAPVAQAAAAAPVRAWPAAPATVARVAGRSPARMVAAAAAAPQPEVITFQAGRRRLVAQGFAAWSLKLRPGLYQATFKAGVMPSTGSPDAPVGVICGLIDLDTVGPATHVFTADSTVYTGVGFPAFLSGAETVHLGRGVSLALVCTTETGRFMMFGSARASFNRVDSRELRAARRAPVTIPRDGIRFEG